MLENKTYDEIVVGEEASINRVLTANDLYVFAHASGNFNPMHLPGEASESGNGSDPVAPSMWVGTLISGVLGNVLPGPGTLYQGQSFKFHDRVKIGDAVTVSVKVVEKGDGRLVKLDSKVIRADGVVVCTGCAEVTAPDTKITFNESDMPTLMVESHQHIERLMDSCEGLEPLPTAVVAPEESNALGGVILAARQNLIRPILIGDPKKIAAVAHELKSDISGMELIAERSHGAAAARAVDLVNEGEAHAIMKGHLHTDELLRHVVKRDGGLRTDRRLSHVFVMDVPGLDHLLMVTDAAINIAPTLEEKVDIVQNAIDLARALGIDRPKVGVLSAVELVNPRMSSTLDAAVLSKMAERGQIRGGLVDGPLAMDNALSIAAAQTKGITSLVAGRAEVLMVPNLESGNILAKELAFVAHAEGAGVVLGAKVPIMLTSRADNDQSRLASCAVATLYHAWTREEQLSDAAE